MDKIIVAIITGVILLAVLFWGWQSGFFASVFSGPAKQVPVPEGVILFYGDGCPHCENVEAFVSENKIEDKISFIRLEVWKNKDNQSVLAQVLAKCGITTNQISVPLLFDGTDKCYAGDVDVINFFKNASGIK